MCSFIEKSSTVFSVKTLSYVLGLFSCLGPQNLLFDQLGITSWVLWVADAEAEFVV